MSSQGEEEKKGHTGGDNPSPTTLTLSPHPASFPIRHHAASSDHWHLDSEHLSDHHLLDLHSRRCLLQMDGRAGRQTQEGGDPGVMEPRAT